MENSHSIFFLNENVYEGVTSTIIEHAKLYLTPNAYELLNILARYLMKHLLILQKAGSSAIHTLSKMETIKIVKLSVFEYMYETKMKSFKKAFNQFISAGVELKSFYMSYNFNELKGIEICHKDGLVYDNINLLEQLVSRSEVDENNRYFFEFNSHFVEYLVAKYYDDEDFKDYTADQLLFDFFVYSLDIVQNRGFELGGEFLEDEFNITEFINSRFIQK